MTRSTDLLSQRVAEWAAECEGVCAGYHGLRGWALREAIERRPHRSPHLVEIIDQRSAEISTTAIPELVDHAMSAWRQLLSDLDREENNLEHVRRQTRDVFFCLMETFLVLDEFGESVDSALGESVFNTVVNDLYVFEAMADIAAELDRPGRLGAGLTDLFCGGVSRLFDGTARIVDEGPANVPVEEFVSLDALLRRFAGGKRLTLAAIAQWLAGVEWGYLRWVAQRLKLQLNAATGELRVDVFEGDFDATPTRSTALDGWEIRAGSTVATTIRAGGAILRLSDRLPTGLNPQVRQSNQSEWLELFARVPQSRQV